MTNELTLFNDFWSDFPSSVHESRHGKKIWLDNLEKVMNGKCDFGELDDHYEIELEVPGVRKNEIDINLQKDYLTITWSRKKEKKKGLLKKHTVERSEGSFSRSFPVAGADAEKISAALKAGVLKINLPKKEEVKPRRIQIN